MKPLPVIWPEFKGQKFDCRGCTNCCRDLVVHLTADDRARIDRHDWTGRIDAAPYVRLGGAYVLNHAADGACVFLQPDGRCRIHAEFGADEKPLACRIYPFSADRAGPEILATIRFDCPTVVQNQGGGVGAHRDEVETLARRLLSTQAAGGAKTVWRMTERRALSSVELDRVLGDVDRWLKDASAPLTDRMIALSSLVETLHLARIESLGGDGQLEELVSLLVDDLPVVLRDYRKSPPAEPTDRQMRLFRQIVFASGESISFEEARASIWKRLAGRLDQLRRSRQLARGTGSVPILGRRPVAASVESIESVGPVAEAERAACDEMLTRYFRVRLATRSAFGPAYYGFTVLEGVRALVLAFAAIGWFARYFAAGERRGHVSIHDVSSALQVVDRNAGRAPVLGTASARLRARYLAEHDGMRRLLTKFRLV